jgi:hypothetical protein
MFKSLKSSHHPHFFLQNQWTFLAFYLYARYIFSILSGRFHGALFGDRVEVGRGGKGTPPASFSLHQSRLKFISDIMRFM